ncbi:MAG: hypothetical protein J0I97_06050 [Microbacterium sp.]|uniref:hypothetical protein n=2 Tax=Microbacterium sp. TaxID=51671 RepID=UPI001ACD3939|nr:hypothetical protein [Microbacterium sp.]MBN9152448.1 hypothetical protein [Microbacterium sp.]MBN9185014.1 hypothetical protein [Microbacterium sp.]MBN9188211.1 hypothetical protein [Microbacterium sp.]
MGKQLINVVGIVVVFTIVVVGTLLIGLPLITQSFATGAQAGQVDHSNAVMSGQVTALQAEKKDLATLTAQVDALHEQIPSVNKQDDVFEIVASAAAASGATVKSVRSATPVAWAARTTIETADASTAGATSSGGDTTANAASGATPAPTPAAPTRAPTPSDGTATGASTPAPAAPTQEQIPFEIIVDVPDAASAAAFIDALGKGPRLLGIVHAALAKSQETLELTVNALAFVHTSN